MMNFLQKRMEKVLNKVNKYTLISENVVNEITREIRLSLLDADVNIKVVKQFIGNIKQKAIGKVASDSANSSQEVIKIIRDELTKILGNQKEDLNLNGNPARLMIVGLQGSGKTTTLGKITKFLRDKEKKFKKPLLVAGDVYRPAAIEQLRQIASQINVDFFEQGSDISPEKIVENAMKHANENDNDVVLIDTAGRLHIDEKLMVELEEIKKVFKPEEIMFVADAMSGQDLINVATEFHNRLKLTSSVITKFDSDARGGAALSIRSLLNIPIKFMGVGEKLDDIDKFYPDRVTSRILGLGDIDTLIEKSSENIDQKLQERMMQRMVQGRFDLNDLMLQMEQMSKMGSIGGIMKMIPGFKKISAAQEENIEDLFNTFKILISSMTMKERRNPKLLNHPKRKNRILKGSGRTIQEYNNLIRRYEKGKKHITTLAKQMNSGIMPDFSKLGGGGFNFK